MRHIDRKDLYTNLEARIQYLHTFLDFGSSEYFLERRRQGYKAWRWANMCSTLADDIEALITGAKYIKQLIPAIVNIVYHKLLQYDITARAFQTRSTSCKCTRLFFSFLPWRG